MPVKHIRGVDIVYEVIGDSGPWVTVAVSLNVTGAPVSALKLTVTGMVVVPEASVTGTG